jgi:transposase-like protein
MEAGENVSVLARELGVSRKIIDKWASPFVWTAGALYAAAVV